MQPKGFRANRNDGETMVGFSHCLKHLTKAITPKNYVVISTDGRYLVFKKINRGRKIDALRRNIRTHPACSGFEMTNWLHNLDKCSSGNSWAAALKLRGALQL